MKLSAWAKKYGISYKTAWRWVKEGKMPVPVEITPSGTILVHDKTGEQHYLQMKYPTMGAIYACIRLQEKKSELEKQIVKLLNFANSRGLPIAKTVKEIGTWMDGKRQEELIKLLADPTITLIIVEKHESIPPFCIDYLNATLGASGRKILFSESEKKKDLSVTPEVLSHIAEMLQKTGTND